MSIQFSKKKKQLSIYKRYLHFVSHVLSCHEEAEKAMTRFIYVLASYTY